MANKKFFIKSTNNAVFLEDVVFLEKVIIGTEGNSSASFILNEGDSISASTLISSIEVVAPTHQKAIKFEIIIEGGITLSGAGSGWEATIVYR